MMSIHNETNSQVGAGSRSKICSQGASFRSKIDFHNGAGLLALWEEYGLTISRSMVFREMELGETSEEAIRRRLSRSIEIMKASTTDPLSNPIPSMGGLIGGEAKALWDYSFPDKTDGRPSEERSACAGNSDSKAGPSCSPAAPTPQPVSPLCGNTLSKAIAYAMAVLEVNASMGLIVAAPTAGSSGVIPGAVLAVCQGYGLGEEAITDGLLNASAIGYLIMRNASVAGAEAGCQAEVGAASAMAASAIAQLLGGSPQTCLHAASLALSNLLGLVCDPIAGLVEAPCQSRNAIGVSNAFTSAQLALAGVRHPIPFDEMVDAMYKVGLSLPFELRETALGGNAAAPSACTLCGGCTK